MKYLKTKFYIINTDVTLGVGYHWVAMWRNVYFDSYGLYPLNNVWKYVKYYNEYRVQETGTMTCGLFCIYVIDELEKGRNYTDILNDFSPIDFKKNEQFILSRYK